ncbi:PQQ-binding-like beta-propeller repeat protein [Rosistilla oblonga]|uniref:PQQ-binding-like beta-propeller repeat protein n=1 Tax=Rosistilla oblonga TaxID=2527990 RepID=UPI003A9743E5
MDTRANRFLPIFFLLAGLVVSTATAAEPTWTQFRGADRAGIVPDAALPVQWDAKKNIRWRTELPGEGWSSPVTDGKRIYLTAAIPSDKAAAGEDASNGSFDLSLLIIDAETGELQTQQTLIHQTAEETQKIHAKNSHASPTTILDGDRLYSHFGFQGTVCTDLQGKTLWINRDLSFKAIHGNGGSPVLVDNRLVFTCDGASEPFVAALKTDTGELAWKCPRPVEAKKKFSFCTPAVIKVDGKQQIVAPGSNCVLGIDPADGSILWQVDYDGYSVIPQPVYAGGILIVCTSYDKGGLLAIDPRGRGNITETNVLWQLDKGAPKTPTPLMQSGLLYMINDAGVAYCLDAASGDRVWQKRIGGQYSASPLLADGKIYFTSEAGETTVIQASRDFQELARNDLGERTLASLAPLDSSILLRTAKALYRIETP